MSRWVGGVAARCLVGVCCCLAIACSQTITWLGVANGANSVAWAVSANGRVVVGGVSYYPSFTYNAFRWTPEAGMTLLGVLAGYSSSFAYDVTPDGTVVVGRVTDIYGASGRAFRWRASSGMQNLGVLPNRFLSAAYGVSADGATVVGDCSNGDFWSSEAVLWRSGGGPSTFLPGRPISAAFAVSADGRVVAGVYQNAQGALRAFRWSANEGMRDLGTLGGTHSEARDLSADAAWLSVGRKRVLGRRLIVLFAGRLLRECRTWAP